MFRRDFSPTASSYTPFRFCARESEIDASVTCAAMCLRIPHGWWDGGFRPLVTQDGSETTRYSLVFIKIICKTFPLTTTSAFHNPVVVQRAFPPPHNERTYRSISHPFGPFPPVRYAQVRSVYRSRRVPVHITFIRSARTCKRI